MAENRKDRPLRRLPTLDKDPIRLLKLWQQEGRIPSIFKSWEELDQAFLDLLASGKTQAEARKELGVTYRNILGSHILEKNESSSGSIRGLNKRAIREDYNVASEQFLRKQFGQDYVNREKARLLQDWNKLSEAERVAVQTAFNKQFHRGHGYSALSGGSISIDNMWPEHGLRNVLHGSASRWPVEIMRRLNVTESDLQDAYNKILEAEGLGLDLRPDNAQAIAMDEYMVSPTSRTDYMSDPEAGLNPDRAEMLISRQRQLAAQGVNRQSIENYNRNLSGTLSVGNAVNQSGEVRTIVEGSPRLRYRVSPAEGGRTTTRIMKWNAIPQGGGKAFMPRVGKGLGLLGVGAAALGAASPAEAALNVAEAATGADQLYGTNQRNVQMVMVNGKPRPFDPDTNTLVDDPTKGLQKKNGKWVEVTRGQGVASRRQQQQIRSTASQAVRTVQRAAETVNPATSLINNLLMPSVNRFSQIINNIIRPDT